MQGQQTTQRPAFSYARFYKDCAIYPELPKFRRFAAQWTKKLYDDIEELVKKEEELDSAIPKLRRRASGTPLAFLDHPRMLVQPGTKLHSQWLEYERMLRTYSQDLCLFHQTFQLPDHAPYSAKRLKVYSRLFQNGNFEPTNERGAAAAYLDPAARDFVACVGIDSSDILTSLWVRNVDWVERYILRRVRGLFTFSRQSARGTQLTYVEFSTIVKTIDAITCVFVPLLLTATMFALARTRPLMARIAVVGALGLVFSASAKIISGRLSRGETFAYTSAFFAVASVFVSTTDDSVSKGSGG